MRFDHADCCPEFPCPACKSELIEELIVSSLAAMESDQVVAVLQAEAERDGYVREFVR